MDDKKKRKLSSLVRLFSGWDTPEFITEITPLFIPQHDASKQICTFLNNIGNNNNNNKKITTRWKVGEEYQSYTTVGRGSITQSYRSGSCRTLPGRSMAYFVFHLSAPMGYLCLFTIGTTNTRKQDLWVKRFPPNQPTYLHSQSARLCLLSRIHYSPGAVRWWNENGNRKGPEVE